MINIKVGDWVSGASLQDERFRGFVEELNTAVQQATIRVVESDRQEVIGEVVRSKLKRLRKIPFQPLQSKEALNSLIDLALVTNDKEWFIQLTTQLNALEEKQLNQETKVNRSDIKWQRFM